MSRIDLSRHDIPPHILLSNKQGFAGHPTVQKGSAGLDLVRVICVEPAGLVEEFRNAQSKGYRNFLTSFSVSHILIP